ncbi:MAG: polysaccharide biosynthesis/export family protein [Candidatus Eisenbacteria bacterium]|nr:polysaccharide biosynthesis/export family protein [Candidatus Eisenbacteria bacterium]
MIRNVLRPWFAAALLAGAPLASTAAIFSASHAETTPAPHADLTPASSYGDADSLALDWSSVPEYRIVPGDELTLDFGPRADLNGDILREMVVRPDGRISVFPVGDVIAAGRTPRELEGALVKLLAGDIRAPRVIVELSRLAVNQVHVIGEVVRVGPVTADPYMTVVQAITAAGGFKEGAARNNVLVFNRNGANTVRVAEVRVDDVLKFGGLKGDLRLSRFDIVYVPRSTVGNIEVFTRMFFGGLTNVTSFAFEGWELFNLDRVFIVPGHK